MNIFITNDCPVISAQDLTDIHVRKMVVELGQLLSTAHHVLDGQIVGYKPTHQNHPSNKWVRECSGNYGWAYKHFKALCEEYTHRTGKIHKTSELLITLEKQPQNMRKGVRTSFAMAMPDNHKIKGIFDATKAYQSYLTDKYKEWGCRYKPIKVEWTNRKQPEWY